MKIYIAGPMRGRPFFNFGAFDDMRDELQRLGYIVISPADLDRAVGFDPYEPKSLRRWGPLDETFTKAAIRRDVNAICDCDAIFMLEGWSTSVGATAEKRVAEWAGLRVFYRLEDVPDEEAAFEEPIIVST